jgi:molecular chaperone HscB
MPCWKCHHPEPATGPTCPACGALQPLPPGSDHFAVLDLPRRYDLAREEVEGRQRALARLLHPDRHARAEATERRLSLLWATAVNDAAKVLRDPVRRAEYLLKLLGLDVGDEQGAQRHVDPAFLMEMLEQREALAEARAAQDHARVETLAEAMRGRRAALLAEIGAGFAALGEPPAAADLEALARHLAVMRYYGRFLDEIAAHEEARYQERA